MQGSIDMKTFRRSVSRLLLSVLLAVQAARAQSAAASPAASPERSRQIHQTIAANLETGGDLYLIANLDGMVEGAIARIRALLARTPLAGTAPTTAVQTALDRLPAFLQSSGLDAVDGIGMSTVPRADGLNSIRIFLCRDPAAADRPLWQALLSGPPRRLASLDYLPADTVLARAGSGDPRQIWKLAREASRTVAAEQGLTAFDAGARTISAQIGTNLETLVNSLSGEGFVALQLSTRRNVQIPLPGPADAAAQPLSIPAPAILIGVAVRNDALPATVRALIMRTGLPLGTETAEEGTLQTLTLPIPGPIPLTPTFTLHRGMFLLGSTREIVQEAIQAASQKDGLAASAPFQKTFKGLPLENNGLTYLDPRLVATIQDVQQRLLQQRVGAGVDSAAKGLAVLRSLSALERRPAMLALVNVNTKDGVLTRGVSTGGGREVMAGLAIAPVGMLSAIAVPSFVKARATARKNACLNNLRMLDAAKEQWAMDGEKQTGTAVATNNVTPFLKAGQIPLCPQGGAYTLGPVGTPPRCAIHGSLP
jgi:hypothetical protein